MLCSACRRRYWLYWRTISVVKNNSLSLLGNYGYRPDRYTRRSDRSAMSWFQSIEVGARTKNDGIHTVMTDLCLTTVQTFHIWEIHSRSAQALISYMLQLILSRVIMRLSCPGSASQSAQNVPLLILEPYRWPEYSNMAGFKSRSYRYSHRQWYISCQGMERC